MNYEEFKKRLLSDPLVFIDNNELNCGAVMCHECYFIGPDNACLGSSYYVQPHLPKLREDFPEMFV